MRTQRVWASCSRMPKKPTGNYGGRLPPPLRTSRVMRRSRRAHPRSPRVLGSGDPGLQELSNRTQQRSRAPVAALACPHTVARACRNVVCAVGESRELHPCESGGLSQRHPARSTDENKGVARPADSPTTAQPLAERRMVLAGYRLADVLKHVFPCGSASGVSADEALSVSPTQALRSFLR